MYLSVRTICKKAWSYIFFQAVEKKREGKIKNEISSSSENFKKWQSLYYMKLRRQPIPGNYSTLAMFPDQDG